MSEARSLAVAVRAAGLSRFFGVGPARVAAVDDATFELAAGEMVAVMGPSGCGKSTLLHLLAGLDRPSGGEVWVGGYRLGGMGESGLARMRRRTVGIVFQDFHLMEEMTAAENVQLPALLAGSSARAARRRADALMDAVGVGDRAGWLPGELSGGERQRVAVARAVINQPSVLLADEPTGNLDSVAAAQVLGLFERLRSLHQAVLVVTHDETVAAIADRRLFMRDGSLIAGGVGN